MWSLLMLVALFSLVLILQRLIYKSHMTGKYYAMSMLSALETARERTTIPWDYTCSIIIFSAKLKIN